MFGGDPDKVTIAANVPILDFGGNMKKALMEFITFFETTHSDVKKNTISIPVKTEVYSELFQISDLEPFAKRINGQSC